MACPLNWGHGLDSIWNGLMEGSRSMTRTGCGQRCIRLLKPGRPTQRAISSLYWSANTFGSLRQTARSCRGAVQYRRRAYIMVSN